MHRMLRLLAFVLIAALGAMTVPASAGASGARRAPRSVTLRLRGVDRNGQQTPITAWEINDGVFQDGAQQLSSGSGNRLAPGRYTIGALVPTMVDGSDIANTFVLRTLTLRQDMTVVLSARDSVPVTISLDGLPQQQPNLAAVVCVHNLTPPAASNYLQLISWAPSQQASLNPPLYVTPYRAKNVIFGFGTWAQKAGTAYNLAQSDSGGLPAHPAARFATVDLAHVALRVPTGEFSHASGGGLYLQGAANACGGVPEYNDPLSAAAVPSVTSEYFSPGDWSVGFAPAGIQNSIDTMNATFEAGHDYSETFYGAAWGPGRNLPGEVPFNAGRATVFDGISFPLLELFEDPAGVGIDTAARAVVSLSARGKLLRRSVYRDLGSSPYFGYGIRHAGWYSLQVTAHRRDAVLSPEVTIGWKFYAR